MKLYHRTNAANAEAILRDGFRDSVGTYLTDQEWTGVWVSDRPFDEGAEESTLLQIELALPEDAIADYEWIEDGKGYREWLVPARLLNEHANVRVVDVDCET
jgi:hypothetical protein